MYAVLLLFFFCFKQKTAYEFRISDWSSDVCSSDLMRDCVVKAEKSGGLRVVCGPAAAFVRCHGASPCGQSRIAPALDGQKPRWRRGCLDQIGRAACRARVWKNVEI